MPWAPMVGLAMYSPPVVCECPCCVSSRLVKPSNTVVNNILAVHVQRKSPFKSLPDDMKLQPSEAEK